MCDIPIIQRERCKCRAIEPRPGEIVITWSRGEAERIKTAAALMDIEPEALIRQAVDDRVKESTFSPAIRDAWGG